ncbi:hypothetical protein CN890_07375 [Priestia megaterium]|uniref:hypothetical protein n=1 Tax=Priestia megaterium TaxID=1404 RepID=UPI000BFD7029|nr:hypothetical protein [Priestia megaterium]MDR4220525.1 hypothetical protein [Priestia megaterium]PGH74123.1 hypothetical protein CN890_07375 [Priestia megaterium]PGO38129.1 hypothetical protein CN973_14615 [Priestia megaterium]
MGHLLLVDSLIAGIVCIVLGILFRAHKTSKFLYGIGTVFGLIFVIGTVTHSPSNTETSSVTAEKVEANQKDSKDTSELKALVTNGMTDKEFQKEKEKAAFQQSDLIALGNGEVGYVIKAEDGYVVADTNGETISSVETFKTADEVEQYELNEVKKVHKDVRAVDAHYTASDLESLEDFDQKINEVLKRVNLTKKEFNELKLKDVKTLTSHEIEVMKAIRDSVSPLTKDTLLQKTIPAKDIEKYVDGSYTAVGGYVAKAEDVHDITSYKDFVESLRLDYTDGSGKRPFPEEGSTYGVIKFKSQAISHVDIPYGTVFGGKTTDGPPCTLNGFTGSRNGETVPEFKFDNYYPPANGAELYQVVNGEEVLLATYVAEEKRFVPAVANPM